MDAESGIPPGRREHSDGGRERQERQDAKPLSRLMMRCRDGTRAWPAWLLGCLADLASPSRRAFLPRFLGSKTQLAFPSLRCLVGSDEAMLGIVSKVPLRLGLKSSLDSGSNTQVVSLSESLRPTDYSVDNQENSPDWGWSCHTQRVLVTTSAGTKTPKLHSQLMLPWFGLFHV